MNLIQDGVIVMEDVLPSGLLAGLRLKARRLVAAHRKAWHSGILDGSQSAIFYDIVAPKLGRRYAERVLSASRAVLKTAYSSAFRVTDIRLRITKPHPFPYLQWHRDHLGLTGDEFKATLFLSDVYPENGEFCYVPGSHLVSPSRIRKATGEHIAVSMGYRRYPALCGTVILFDNRGLHTVMNNRSAHSRVAVILSLSNTGR